MNNKEIVDDWRIKLLLPLIWFIDFLLKQRPIASTFFERAKPRYSLLSIQSIVHYPKALESKLENAIMCIYWCCRKRLRNNLLSIYTNKESVDETLVEALIVCTYVPFVLVVTGPSGPNPVHTIDAINLYTHTSFMGSRGSIRPHRCQSNLYTYSFLPSQLSNVKSIVLEEVGHCPRDNRPDLVHEKLLPWLAETSLY